MAQAILVAALTGVLLIGAKTAGTEAGKGMVKLVHAIHHKVVKPVQQVVKYETTTKK